LPPTHASSHSYRNFTHPFAATGSKRLLQEQQKAPFLDISKLPARWKWKRPFAGSTNWKQRLAESTSSVIEVCSEGNWN
jgi:hypothetical protein